ncbi:MAG: hypothetical protein J5533_04850 [Bacteroidales bacterium]|nr:hypothetical protein [Bacteroidales bacterium]
MKAYRLIVLLFVAGLLSTGCSKEWFPGPDDDRYDRSGGMTLIDFDVKSANWVEREGMFEVELNVPEITKQVLNQGNVQVSRRYPGEGSADDVWTPLPAMRTEVTTAEDGGDFYFTTFIDYEWTVGSVFIYVTTTDLYTGDRPSDMSFRVLITR